MSLLILIEDAREAVEVKYFYCEATQNLLGVIVNKQDGLVSDFKGKLDTLDSVSFTVLTY